VSPGLGWWFGGDSVGWFIGGGSVGGFVGGSPSPLTGARVPAGWLFCVDCFCDV